MPEQPPTEVVALAERRAEARVAKDWAASDSLRDEIAELGWVVRDGADGFELAPRPPYVVAATPRELPDRADEPSQGRATVAILVEGWPDDVRRCLASVLEHAPYDVGIVALDLGNVDGAGDALHEVAKAHPGRIQELHLAAPCGWAQARTALARADVAHVHIWLDPCIELTGDAITPLVDALAEPSVVEAGGFGVDVAADWLTFADAHPGPVDALNGYLAAFRRTALQQTAPHPKATFYRNADLELSFALREAGGVVLMTGPLPVTMHRHRGYHDSDPELRDRESKRTYDRFLSRYRGKDHLRARR